MNPVSFVEQLKRRLELELPGEKAQFLMAPPSRKRYTDLLSNTILQPRLSAVIILVYPDQDVLKTLLIQRPKYEGVHSGQIAFPGGKFENEDKTLLNTAIRETKEEIGVELQSHNIIGSLSDVYIYPSNFMVKPFVAIIDKKPDMYIDKREVDLCIETNVLTLRDSSIKKETTISYSNGLKIKTPYYDVEGFVVWGATAMIISELNAVLDDL